jgi:hypothetical protein
MEKKACFQHLHAHKHAAVHILLSSSFHSRKRKMLEVQEMLINIHIFKDLVQKSCNEKYSTYLDIKT